ncbi:hypothetical protein [Metallosphaera tengchongensis]|uniref:hypothetical protein n=1 Tax=Metallosphaera tengchongensis TaxID=1532350 RepID=UPI001C2ED563|nr:hypothetical protein [Metallosphaera tengchongensis]
MRSGSRSSSIPDGSVRTIAVWLSPNGAQQRKIRESADASARLYNVVNYERRQ